jgi:RimJ/RimL family protein N-acetyltransferase
MVDDEGVGGLMKEDRQGKDRVYFRFLPANRCRAGLLISAYGTKDRDRQILRIDSLLAGTAASQHYFAVAFHKGQAIAILQLYREREKIHRFRIRGLHCRFRFRNRGLATRLLQLGAKSIFEFYLGSEIVSFVLPTNIASITAHQHAGFHIGQAAGLQPENHRFLILRKSP